MLVIKWNKMADERRNGRHCSVTHFSVGTDLPGRWRKWAFQLSASSVSISSGADAVATICVTWHNKLNRKMCQAYRNPSTNSIVLISNDLEENLYQNGIELGYAADVSVKRWIAKGRQSAEQTDQQSESVDIQNGCCATRQ